MYNEHADTDTIYKNDFVSLSQIQWSGVSVLRLNVKIDWFIHLHWFSVPEIWTFQQGWPQLIPTSRELPDVSPVHVPSETIPVLASLQQQSWWNLLLQVTFIQMNDSLRGVILLMEGVVAKLSLENAWSFAIVNTSSYVHAKTSLFNQRYDEVIYRVVTFTRPCRDRKCHLLNRIEFSISILLQDKHFIQPWIDEQCAN